MRRVLSLFVLLCGAAAPASAETFLLMECAGPSGPYKLVYDGRAGTLASLHGSSERKYVLRSMVEEGGSILVRGYAGQREIEFSHRYTPTMTTFYANGGKRVDTCRILQRARP